jgi:hypothetical protein
MPGNINEKQWKRAKKIARKQLGRISYPLVMHIYQNMQKAKLELDNLSENNIEDIKKNITEIKEHVELLNKIREAKKWAPSREYSEEEHQKIKPLLDQGFSLKEASFMHDLEPQESYLSHPEPMSEAMMGHAKKIAQDHVSDWKEKKIQGAKAATAPKYAELKETSKMYNSIIHPVYKDMFKNMTSSEDFKNLPTAEKVGKINELKSKFYDNHDASIKEHNHHIHSVFSSIKQNVEEKREKALYNQRKALAFGD